MSIPKSKIRNIKDIRTLSGTVDQVHEPFRAFLRIGILEMEKARRNKERESAMFRVNNIDARFRDIEAEKEELLRRLGREGTAKDTVTAHDNVNASPCQSKQGFRIRY